MKKIALTLCAAAFLFACKNDSKEAKPGDSSVVETPKADAKSEAWVPVDSATAMKTMMEYATPGKEQAAIAKTDGAWSAETTMWMAPDAPPMTSKGDVQNKMIMGGRYQQMTFKGNMMGQPFEGQSVTGYDNARKVWTSSWIDNMSTGIMNMDGSWDEATKTFTYNTKMLCPANGKWCDIKETIKLIDDKNMLMEMWGPDMKTGKSYKNMEIKMVKK